MATYFVAPDGSDGNAGTKADPLGSIEAAADRVGPGDTIYLRGGTYDRSSNVSLNGSDGTESDPILLAGYRDERPVIRFDGPDSGGWSAYDAGGLSLNVAYWKIRNLTVENSPYMGIVADGSSNHHNTFADLEVRNCYLVGFALYNGAHDNLVTNVTAHGNVGNAGDADGIQFSDTARNTLRNSVSYENSDDGVDLWESVDCRIENCAAFGNGLNGGNGNGFKLGGSNGGATSGGHVVHHCRAYDNSYNGFNNNGANETVEVFNCTSYDNGGKGYVAWDNGSDATHVYRNCIAYRNADGAVDTGSEDEETRNTWNLDIGDPQFRSTDPDADGFLRPATDSPVVDAGIDVGLDYAGEAPDLGAFEARSGSSGPSGPAVRYHDGSGWRDATLKYHDGSGFVEAKVNRIG